MTSIPLKPTFIKQLSSRRCARWATRDGTELETWVQAEGLHWTRPGGAVLLLETREALQSHPHRCHGQSDKNSKRETGQREPRRGSVPSGPPPSSVTWLPLRPGLQPHAGILDQETLAATVKQVCANIRERNTVSPLLWSPGQSVQVTLCVKYWEPWGPFWASPDTDLGDVKPNYLPNPSRGWPGTAPNHSVRVPKSRLTELQTWATYCGRSVRYH